MATDATFVHAGASARGHAAAAAIRAEPLLVGLIVLAAALRFGFLAHQSFWADEAYTAALVREPLPDLVRHIPKTESTPPLYYVVAWAWAKLFGTSEAGLRSLSALVGTATVPIAYAAGRELVGRRAGLITAALVATSPLLVWYSQEARAYALVTLLAAASVYFFARAFNRARGRPVLWLAVVSVLALLTHYYAVLLFAVEAGILLTRPVLRRQVLWAAAAVGASGLALLPLVRAQHPGHRTGWIDLLPLRGRLEEIPAQFAFGQASLDIRHASAIAFLAVAALRLGVSFVAVPRRPAAFAVALAGGSMALALVSKAVGVDFFYYRPLVYVWIPVAIAAAAVFASPRLGRGGVVAAAAFCAGLALCTLAVAARPALQRENWRGAVALIGARDPARAVVVAPWWPTSAFEYYRPTLRLPRTGAPVREIVVISRGVRVPLAIPRTFVLVERRNLDGFGLERYRALHPVTVRSNRLVKVDSVWWWARLDRAPAKLRPPEYGIQDGKY